MENQEILPFSIKNEISKQITNYCSMELVKKEDDNIKLEPESNVVEFEDFPRNTDIQDLSHLVTKLDNSNDFSVEPIQSVVKVENTYKIEKSNEITVGKWKIKNEELDIKTEDSNLSQNSMLVNSTGNKKYEDQSHQNENQSDVETTQISSIKKPFPYQLKPGQVFKCHKCNFKTLDLSSLKNHFSIGHINSEEIRIVFKCDHCEYETRYKDSLKKHDVRHKNGEDLNIFKCDHCEYSTVAKGSLNRHVLRHKNPEDVPMFKCNQCDFQTVYKCVLKIHELKHKNPGDVETFKCDHCDYETLRKGSYKRHLLRHKKI